mmetsp:Transcript_18651/g.55881  ORF Transcript_18651/g.55881 Transcript_18651/m.55881 type:complete len:256 (+) Transcript_18651:1758-2525(+)
MSDSTSEHGPSNAEPDPPPQRGAPLPAVLDTCTPAANLSKKPLRKAPAPPASDAGAHVLPELTYRVYARKDELCVEVRRVWDLHGESERSYRLFAAADSIGQQAVVAAGSAAGALLVFRVGRQPDGSLARPLTLLIHVADAEQPSIVFGCLSVCLPELLATEPDSAPLRYALALPPSSLPHTLGALARFRSRVDAERSLSDPESISVSASIVAAPRSAEEPVHQHREDDEQHDEDHSSTSLCWRARFLDTLTARL